MKPDGLDASARKEARGLPKVVAAAIRVNSTLVFSVEAPKRHHDIIRDLAATGYEIVGRNHEQGFLTSEGRYLGRQGARQLVVDNGQARRSETFTHPHELFSEDLW